MKIYKSENYISEKLTIKPISKTRLGKILDVDKYKSAADMRGNLQTGDIVVIGNEDENIQGTYISYNDIKSGVYDSYFHFIKRISELPNSEIAEGLFVFWEKEGFYSNISAQEFDDDLKKFDTFRIVYVYRLPLLLQKPLPEEFFKTNHIPKAKLIWSYNGKSVNEKLDIQPVTRERLGDIKDGVYAIAGCVVEWDEDMDYINQKNIMYLNGSKKLPIRMKSDSLEELLINFAKKVAPTHKLDFLEDLDESELKNYRLVLYLKGILNKNTMEFRDATEKEFDDFLTGKRTLTNAYYYIDITKGGMREDLGDEMKQLHKKYNGI